MNSATASPQSEVDCAIVGAGPAGAVLSLLLAAQGLRVVLLEAASDFDREFRGDTLHPSVMEIMEELGLAGRLLDLPHVKIRRGVGEVPGGEIPFYDFSRLKTSFPYITMMPQTRFLDFITTEAGRFSGFALRMRARVHELLSDDVGNVRGVRYRDGPNLQEVRARLVVGCDGRGSVVRRLARLDGKPRSAPMDILWFRLPRRESDGGIGFRTLIGRGYLLVLIDRGKYWQAGCVIRKGGFHTLREAGLEEFRTSLVQMAPEFGDRVGELDDWSRISILSVQSMRLTRWWRPGLLLIGDAAHVMSPIGGAGINLAIQDAVVTANRIAGPLRTRTLEEAHLASVEHSRLPAVALVQAFQAVVEKVLVSPAIDERRGAMLPWLCRIPVLGALPSRLVAFGPWRVHVKASDGSSGVLPGPERRSADPAGP